jgi:capsular exopolysaccharide synthesis family protein
MQYTVIKDASPHGRQPVVLLEPEGALSNRRQTDADITGDTPNLRDYWRILRKHQWKIAACLAATMAVTAVIVFSMTRIYVARATLMIERKGPHVVKIQQVAEEAEAADETSFYESQYQVLKSRSLAGEVIKTHKLDADPKFLNQRVRKFSIGDLLSIPIGFVTGLVTRLLSEPAPVPGPSSLSGVDSKLIDIYADMVDVEPLKRSRLVTIAVSSPDPDLSARIANAHATAYIQYGFKLRSQANEEARKFLEGKLGELKERVEKSESTLNEFRRGKGIISLDEKENIVVDRLADLNRRLTEAEAERIGFEAQARLIKSRQYDSLPAVIGNGLIQHLKGQIVQLEAEHAKLSEQYLPGYPRLAQVKAQLEESRTRLSQQINNVVEGINSAYLAAAGKEKDLRKQMDEQKAATFALKDASVQYAILAREAATNKQLYDSVQERFREISVAGELPASNISIVDRAEIPQLPAKPNKRLNLMMGAFLGLFGGLGLALLLEHLNNTFRNPGEVERYLRLPNLAVVPDYFSLPKSRWKSLIHRRSAANVKSPQLPPNKPTATIRLSSKISSVDNRRLSVISEGYRKLRTSIFLASTEGPPKSILFTSATAGEGKTTTAANTAIMFAQLGNNVLLIDADLHRPSCHKALKVPGATGLADYLARQGDLNEAIRPTAIANLSVLICGSVPPSPTELIGSKKMRETLSLLKERYDFILIDSPPVMPVSDAVVLSSLTDALVFVVEGQKTPKHLVRSAIAQLGNSQAKILGIVLNRVDIRGPDYRDFNKYYNPEAYHPTGTAT